MKFKNLFKIIICLMLSCSLCVSAPLARYQRIETHAAIAVPIAIGAGTIALMYLAACGVSYIFQGMTQADSEDWIDTKIIEFSEISDGNGGTNGNMPSGNTNWKMTATGAILLGATLANYCEKLKNWLVGEQADNTVNEIESITGLQLDYGTAFVIPKYKSEINKSQIAGPYPYPYTKIIDFFDSTGDNSVYNIDTDYNWYVLFNNFRTPLNRSLYDAYMYFNGVNYGYYSMTNQLDNGSSDYRGYIPIVTKDSYLGWAILRNNGYYVLYSTTTQVSQSDLTESSVSQKTDTVKQNVFIENNYYTQLNPDVQTTTQDLNGVPVPLSADDIADAVWEKISMNTSATTVYQPELLPAADGFSEQPNINTDDYDEPLPEPEPEPQPDWSGMSAGDVPAFTQSVWNYFIQNHSWNQLKQKFPFSLPYDAYLIANIFFDTSYDVMDELPTTSGGNRRLMKSSSAPVYRLDVPLWDGTTYELVLDFSIIDDWVPLIRAGIGVLFTVGLIVGVL